MIYKLSLNWLNVLERHFFKCFCKNMMWLNRNIFEATNDQPMIKEFTEARNKISEKKIATRHTELAQGICVHTPPAGDGFPAETNTRAHTNALYLKKLKLQTKCLEAVSQFKHRPTLFTQNV